MSTSSPPQGPEASTSDNNLALPPSYDEVRQQAGPLPSKRGEIGFMEGIHLEVPRSQGEDVTPLPARHPADRDGSPLPSATLPPNSSAAETGNPPAAGSAESPPSSESTSNPQSTNKRILKNVPCFGGLRLTTLLLFVGQFLLFAGCIVAWVFTAKKLKKGMTGGTSSAVFIHVVFVFAIIGQLVFIERRIYRLRAERYAYLHPGEVLPRYRDRMERGGDLSFAYAPWHRPPLPTYAAVLVQSGHGTGDVDDHLIAVPPPPAYGNTRGSTLLLSGYLRDSLRAQRPPSVHSQSSQSSGVERGSTVARDEPGENRAQASDRGQNIQQTLDQLERATSRP